MNTAQKLYTAWTGMDPDSGGDLRLAAIQTHAPHLYKAPHAPRPTPPRPHRARIGRAKRLFKGHRA